VVRVADIRAPARHNRPTFGGLRRFVRDGAKGVRPREAISHHTDGQFIHKGQRRRCRRDGGVGPFSVIFILIAAAVVLIAGLELRRALIHRD
jgi:hypothetical protein